MSHTAEAAIPGSGGQLPKQVYFNELWVTIATHAKNEGLQLNPKQIGALFSILLSHYGRERMIRILNMEDV